MPYRRRTRCRCHPVAVLPGCSQRVRLIKRQRKTNRTPQGGTDQGRVTFSLSLIVATWVTKKGSICICTFSGMRLSSGAHVQVHYTPRCSMFILCQCLLAPSGPLFVSRRRKKELWGRRFLLLLSCVYPRPEAPSKTFLYNFCFVQ